MALNGFWYDTFWAWAQGEDASFAFSVNIPSSYVRAYPTLQQHLENRGDSQTGVKVNIVEYVQNGTPHHVDAQEVNGPGFTNVTFAIYVNRCSGAGVGNVDIFS